MSLYDRAKVFFSAAAGAGNKGVAYNIKPEEKLKVDEHVTNGSFTGSDGWEKTSDDITFSRGKAVFSGVDGYKYLRTSTPVFEKGKTYKVSFTVTDFTSVGNNNPQLLVQESSNQQPHIGSIKTSGKYVFIYEAKGHESNGVQIGTPSKLVFKNSGPGGSGNEISFKLDNVSVREVEQKANDFSFVRASDLTATHEGADGLIKKTRENLLQYSNGFDNDLWKGYASLAGNTLISTVTGGQTGYDGSNNAFLLNKDTSDLFKRREQIVAQTTGAATFSVYARAGTASSISLRGGSDDTANIQNGNDDRADFNLANGTSSIINNAVASSMEAVTGQAGDTNRWYRCSVVFKDPTQLVQIYVNFNSASTGTVFLQDAQLENGLVATPYIHRTDSNSKSTAGIQENEPRYDYSLDNSLPPVLMLEPERQNLLAHSEYFTFQGRTTITYNHGTSPEGFKNSTRYSNTTETGNHRTYSSSFDVTSGDTYTISAFGKKGTLKKLSFKLRSGNEGQFGDDGETEIVSDEPIFNLFSGSISGDSSNASMVDYGNGWYRCILTIAANTDVTGARVYFYFRKDDGTKSYAGATSENMELYGMQVEQGPYATSYIPTHGSSATRLGEAHNSLSSFRCELDKPLTKKYSFVVDVRVDNLERPTNNFDDIFSARSRGAFFNDYPFRIEGYYNPNDDPDTYTLRVFAYKIGDTGSGTTTPHTNGIQLGVRNKIAIVFDEDSGIKIFVNGNSTPMAQSTEAGAMHNVHFLEGGGNPRSKTFLYGVQAYDEALSDAECVSLTTIS
jgi:hypothetical protein|tara:strand:+ start:30 stop:2393 length:2364 start_codon:yes stop_codon:yes gene_type:complete